VSGLESDCFEGDIVLASKVREAIVLRFGIRRGEDTKKGNEMRTRASPTMDPFILGSAMGDRLPASMLKNVKPERE